MSAGLAQVMMGLPLRTLMETVLVAEQTFAVSVGVKSTFSAWPGLAFSFVAAAGVYTKPPATSAVALSWVPLYTALFLSSAGFAQVMTGLPLRTLMETVLVAVL